MTEREFAENINTLNETIKEDVKEFCNKLNIELTLVPNAPHEFYSYIKQLNKFIINKINNR